jgi:proton-dependent oligopeptide transporter, POT family
MTPDKSFFGHPRGLSTLFFTEMWERFSYYGMRALLLLFMIAAVEDGGMGMDVKTGGAIYGLYTMFVYLLSLPGGWVADKLLGLRKAIFYGGCIIAAGHFLLAFPYPETFFLGLLLIVIGTGLLKPTASALVGEQYAINDQAGRDAGFSIFYMGINIGAFIAPLITSYLGENINWHYGFAAAGVGMVAGLIQFKLTEKNLGVTGLPPKRDASNPSQMHQERNVRLGVGVVLVLLAVFVTLLMTKTITINPITFAQSIGMAMLVCAVIYFVYVFLAEKLDLSEKKKVLAIFIIFIATTVFYMGYEGQGSSLNLFAEKYTDMFLGTFEMPAGWMQSFPAIFVVIFVPVFAWLWISLAKRNVNVSTPVKMALGLIFMGLGYVVMIGASMIVIGGEKPLPTWLILTYMLHTFGEICLYPIGLSAVTRLSPKRLVGQMMGVFFMALALGNLAAGLFAGEFDDGAITANPNLLIDLFGLVAKITLIGGVVVLIISKPLLKLMQEKK